MLSGLPEYYAIFSGLTLILIFSLRLKLRMSFREVISLLALAAIIGVLIPFSLSIIGIWWTITLSAITLLSVGVAVIMVRLREDKVLEDQLEQVMKPDESIHSIRVGEEWENAVDVIKESWQETSAAVLADRSGARTEERGSGDETDREQLFHEQTDREENPLIHVYSQQEEARSEEEPNRPLSAENEEALNSERQEEPAENTEQQSGESDTLEPLNQENGERGDERADGLNVNIEATGTGGEDEAEDSAEVLVQTEEDSVEVQLQTEEDSAEVQLQTEADPDDVSREEELSVEEGLTAKESGEARQTEEISQQEHQADDRQPTKPEAEHHPAEQSAELEAEHHPAEQSAELEAEHHPAEQSAELEADDPERGPGTDEESTPHPVRSLQEQEIANVQRHYGAATTFLRRQEYPSALAQLKQALAYQPPFAAKRMIINDYVRILQEMGLYQQAIEMLRGLLEQVPGDDGKKKREIIYQIHFLETVILLLQEQQRNNLPWSLVPVELRNQAEERLHTYINSKIS